MKDWFDQWDGNGSRSRIRVDLLLVTPERCHFFIHSSPQANVNLKKTVGIILAGTYKMFRIVYWQQKGMLPVFLFGPVAWGLKTPSSICETCTVRGNFWYDCPSLTYLVCVDSKAGATSFVEWSWVYTDGCAMVVRCPDVTTWLAQAPYEMARVRY